MKRDDFFFLVGALLWWMLAAWLLTLTSCAHAVDSAPPAPDAGPTCAACYDGCHGTEPEVVHCADNCYELCASLRDW